MTLELVKNQESEPNEKPNVLIIGDNKEWTEALRVGILAVEKAHRFNLFAAYSVAQGLELLSKVKFHAALIDRYQHPDNYETCWKDLKIISDVAEIQAHIQVLIVSVKETPRLDIARAMDAGAFGFVSRTCNRELFLCQTIKAIEVAQVRIDEAFDRCSIERKLGTLDLGGTSKLFQDVIKKAKAFAAHDIPVLLLGETGVGKTEIAKFIHKHSKRQNPGEQPFVSVNIGALSDELADRELFGNERGAFTDARERRPGFLELANNGTLFLDEIGDASPRVQIKLLKAIEEGEFYRVGGTRPIRSNFKLICATNKDLDELVAKKEFRADLKARISTLTLHIPSLSERKEDIPDILRAKIARWNTKGMKVSFEDFPEDFIDYLKSAPIQGNIRGLDHVILPLLALVPRARNDRPILTNWRKFIEMQPAAIQSAHNTIRFSDLLNRPFDIADPEFPGLPALQEMIAEKLIKEAFLRLGSNAAVRKALKASPAYISNKKAQYFGARENK